ncbi:sulfotransferase [Marinibacterium sp. SX1]|uniref:sulfotransferase n=1 Tax=Marinibacterium sp. SX1 TaxID=3388424 RepID=UPI003D1825AC
MPDGLPDTAHDALRAIVANAPHGAGHFPPDATMFYCIGAQKSGTTWLHRVLQAHDDCHVPIAKEVHFFDILEGHTDLDRRIRRKVSDIEQAIARLTPEIGPANRAALARIEDAAAHLGVFTGQPDGRNGLRPYVDYLLRGRRSERVICDITPAYSMLSRDSFGAMASFGQARFLFLLRDPVSRLWSQLRMGVRLEMQQKTGPDIDETAYRTACLDRAARLAGSDVSHVLRSSYLRTMDNLEAAVPRGRILYMFFEEMFTPPALARLSDFLGIAPIAAAPEDKMNEGIRVSLPADIAAALRASLAPQYDQIADRVGQPLPAAWERAA